MENAPPVPYIALLDPERSPGAAERAELCAETSDGLRQGCNASDPVKQL